MISSINKHKPYVNIVIICIIYQFITRLVSTEPCYHLHYLALIITYQQNLLWIQIRTSIMLLILIKVRLQVKFLIGIIFLNIVVINKLVSLLSHTLNWNNLVKWNSMKYYSQFQLEALSVLIIFYPVSNFIDKSLREKVS